MVDSDLARLYEIPTKAFDQAVRRNMERFPEDFAFQFSKAELEHWRSHVVTSNPSGKETPHWFCHRRRLSFRGIGGHSLGTVTFGTQRTLVSVQRQEVREMLRSPGFRSAPLRLPNATRPKRYRDFRLCHARRGHRMDPAASGRGWSLWAGVDRSPATSIVGETSRHAPVTDEERKIVTEKGARRFDRFEQRLMHHLVEPESLYRVKGRVGSRRQAMISRRCQQDRQLTRRGAS
jgi:ORF6N domain